MKKETEQEIRARRLKNCQHIFDAFKKQFGITDEEFDQGDIIEDHLTVDTPSGVVKLSIRKSADESRN